MILGWTVLQPSVWERRLALLAFATAATTACVLAAAAFAADPREPWLVWSAALAAAAAAFAAGRRVCRRPGTGLELSIDADGVVRTRVRSAVPGSGRPAHCIFAAPWLITLRSGAMLVAVWPDSLAAVPFRRLHACTMWARSAEPAVNQAAAPAQRRALDDDHPS